MSEGDPPGHRLSESSVLAFKGTLERVRVPLKKPISRTSGPIDPAPPVSEYPRHHVRHGERPHYWGHRQRVRDRFAKGGADSMPDYEIVEMLLFSAVPKIDVKPLAKKLLDDFGGIERLLTASREELSHHPSVNDWIVHHFKLAEAVAVRLAKVRIADQPVIAGTAAVIEYCRTAMAHKRVEHFRVLFLNHHHRLLADEEHGRGTVKHTPAYPREVAKRALELNASGVVLVHNHPSGDPRPSREDIAVTQQIKAALDLLGINLCDHIIIAASGETSLAALGALD